MNLVEVRQAGVVVGYYPNFPNGTSLKAIFNRSEAFENRVCNLRSHVRFDGPVGNAPTITGEYIIIFQGISYSRAAAAVQRAALATIERGN